MSDTETPKMKSAIVLREFRDDGTKTTFKPSDKPVEIEEGVFANYEAAGLVKAAPEAASAGKTKPAA